MRTGRLSRRAILLYFYASIFPLERFVAGFTGTDADDLFQVVDEDLAIADFTGTRGTFDRFNGLVDNGVIHGRFNLSFWQEIDDILSATVEFRVTFLATKPFDFGDGNA